MTMPAQLGSIQFGPIQLGKNVYWQWVPWVVEVWLTIVFICVNSWRFIWLKDGFDIGFTEVVIIFLQSTVGFIRMQPRRIPKASKVRCDILRQWGRMWEVAMTSEHGTASLLPDSFGCVLANETPFLNGIFPGAMYRSSGQYLEASLIQCSERWC